jgi:hypothetical protein
MKYSSYVALLLLGLLPLGSAQESKRRFTGDSVPSPTVTHIDKAEACGPGSVELRGRNLELITNVRVAGVEVPMLANDGLRIVFAPPPQIPGFQSLELVQPQGVLAETMVFTPALSGRWLEDHVRLRLDAGGAGWYILNYSFRARRVPLAYPNTHYGEMLDMTIPFSGQLAGGILENADIVQLPPIHVPRGLRTVGGLGTLRPMHVQAYVMTGVNLCFSNLYTLVPAM